MNPMIPVKSKKILYLIDYENLGPGRFCDFIKDVDAANQIAVFYSGDKNTINFDDIHKCKAQINFIKVHNGRKNALDFQLSSFLGYHIAQHIDDDDFVYNYVIVSNDKGFICLSEFWNDEHVNVRVREIDEPLNVNSIIDAKDLINSIGIVMENAGIENKTKNKTSGKKKKKNKKNKSDATQFNAEKARLKDLPPIRPVILNIKKLEDNFSNGNRKELCSNDKFKAAFEHEFQLFFEPVMGDKWRDLYCRFSNAGRKKRFEKRLRAGKCVHPDLAAYVLNMLHNSDLMPYLGYLNPRSPFYK